MKDIWVNYNTDNPYQDHADMVYDYDYQRFKTNIQTERKNVGYSLGLSVSIPFYRIWLIFRDLFINSIQDLCTNQFEGKKFQRLVYNITSALLLDPLYFLAGIPQAIIGIAATFFALLSNDQPGQSTFRLFMLIEYGPSVLYGKLANGLGLDQKEFYECWIETKNSEE